MTAERDPQARARLTATLFALLLLWPMAQLAEFKPWRLFDAGNLQVMADCRHRTSARV